MRFRIQFRVASEARRLPVNYNAALALWANAMFNTPNTEAHTCLAVLGIDEHFTAYTFGQLYLPGFTLQNDWFTLHHEYVFLQISTVPINGLADCLLRAFTETTISIDGADGPVVFIADKVNIMPYTPYDGMMHYRTISPISLINTQTPDFHTEYLSPTAPNYSDLLLTCLAERLTDPYVQASFPSVSTALTDHPVQLRFVGKHRSRLLEMPDGKGGLKKMRSWHTGLMLNALPAVHELVYCIGLGNHTHLGFGCVSEENSK